jgi:hypothetical protein
MSKFIASTPDNVSSVVADWFYIFGAREDAPEGTYCGNCGAINLMADDCGFFYVSLPDNAHKQPLRSGYVAVCSTCYSQGGYTTCER